MKNVFLKTFAVTSAVACLAIGGLNNKALAEEINKPAANVEVEATEDSAFDCPVYTYVSDIPEVSEDGVRVYCRETRKFYSYSKEYNYWSIVK